MTNRFWLVSVPSYLLVMAQIIKQVCLFESWTCDIIIIVWSEKMIADNNETVFLQRSPTMQDELARYAVLMFRKTASLDNWTQL